MLLCGCATGQPWPDEESAEWTPLAIGLNRPTDVRSTGDDLLITERFGLIRVYRAGELLAEPALDLRHLVGSDQAEQGLLALSPDPQFDVNRLIYLYYTDLEGDSVLARYSLPADRTPADPKSGEVILRIDQPYANHNGGGMAFGPDGYLYLGVGDGGGNGDPKGNGQKLDTFLGKLLRIHPQSPAGYRIPDDNPFQDEPAAFPEIWALGLRNPWRIAFDSRSGDLYIGDVGEFRYEEINRLPAGLGGVNFGWNTWEGLHAFEGDLPSSEFMDPVAEYGHSLGCAVTGGAVVYDPRLPSWSGVYLYGDSCSGNVWGLRQSVGEAARPRLLFQSGLHITSFGSNHDGRVYMLDYDDTQGGLFRLDPAD